jgi:predicted DCC family thiol-disulfide oxidoreductase YuxK
MHAMQPLRGTIFFDAGCGLCSTSVRRWRGVVEGVGFAMVPLQSEQAQRELALVPGELPGEIKMQTPAGVLGGVDVFARVARYVWWAFPIHLILSVPAVRDVAQDAYTVLARNRRQISHACGLRPIA